MIDNTIYDLYKLPEDNRYKFTISYEVEEKSLLNKIFNKSTPPTIKTETLDLFISINRSKFYSDYPYYSDITDSNYETIQNEVYYKIIPDGGKKLSTKNITTKRIKVGNVNKVVYKGSKGGEYIKMNGGFISLKKLK
jgi:hypothetical protein